MKYALIISLDTADFVRHVPCSLERCNETDWNGRQFDGKNATHLR